MGRPVAKARSDELATLRKMTMGFVFQHFNLIPRLNVIENVALPLLSWPRSRMLSETRHMSELQRVEMAHRASYKPAELSGGQKQQWPLPVLW